MKKVILWFLFLLISSFALASPTHARHNTSKTKSPSLTASLAKNKLSVNANFNNLTNVTKISYQLTYDSNKGVQGAGGTIKVTSKNKNLSRNMLLGTCSRKVCTYHKNIKNIVVSVEFTLKSGGIISYEKKL